MITNQDITIFNLRLDKKIPEGGFYPYQHFGGIIRGYEIFRRISLRT